MKWIILVVLIAIACTYRPYYGDHRYHKYRPTDTIQMNNGDYLIKFKCMKEGCSSVDTFRLRGNEKFI